MDELVYGIQLPEHWIWVELKDLTEKPKNDIVDGPFGSDLKSNEYTETGIPVFKIQNIKEDRFVDKKINFISPTKAEELSRHSFQKGDLIITKLGNPLGLCCKVPEKYPYGIIVADLIRFRPSARRVVIQYLMYGINSVIVQNQFKAITKGTTRPRVNLTIVRGIKFPLPPLPEQRAIVSKIELLFSELDNGISNLKLAQAQLKVYRQAVLKKAFEGELTKKWRGQQTDLPNAGDLLEQIQKEREEAAKISGRRLSKVAPPTDTELAELPKLPAGWRWAGLGEIIDNIQAGKSIRCDERPPKLNELGIVKVSSVSWGEFNENESKTCFNEGAFNADYIIRGNDFLFSRANTIELVGACVIVKSISKRLMLSDKILKIDFSQNNMKFYSLYYLRSFFGRREIESLATGNQESMRNIGQDRIKQIRIPICSLPEQQVIVQEIETRLSVCDKIEQDIKENLEKAEALRQSILKKAFEGKLLNERELAEVRGAEDWEPAEVLLEKISYSKVTNRVSNDRGLR